MEKQQSSLIPLQIKFYPKVAVAEKPQPVQGANKVEMRRHRRTNSDLDNSTRAEEKWRKYQKEAEVKVRLESDQSESGNVVMSLGLEKEGRVLDVDDMEDLEKTLTTQVWKLVLKENQLHNHIFLIIMH